MLEGPPKSTEPAQRVIAESYNGYEIFQLVRRQRLRGDLFSAVMGGTGAGRFTRNSRFDVESIDVRMSVRGERTRRPLTIV